MKRMTLIGILLVLFAIAVVYLNSVNIQNGFAPGTVQQMLLPANSVKYLELNLSNGTALGIVYYSNDTPIDYYLLTSAGFIAASPYISSNSLIYSAANVLERGGAVVIIHNSTAGEYPYQGPTSQSYQEYQSNSSLVLPQGAYYNVFQNPAKSNDLISYTIYERSESSISSTITTNAIYGLGGVVLFIGGIIVVLYSVIFGRGAQQGSTETSEQAYRAYDRIYAARQGPRRMRTKRASAARRGKHRA